MIARTVRISGADDLGMRHALSDRLLPLLVGAMVFLAALALAGALAAAALAAHWNTGAAAMVTLTVPAPEGAAAATAQSQSIAQVLSQSTGVERFRQLSQTDIAALLKPWLGQDPGALSLRLPAMFELRLKTNIEDPGLADRLRSAAPGALIERNGDILSRLAALVRSLQACAALALLVVTFVAAAVVGVATRAGLAARREAIEIVHGLGATDGLIAGQFAQRITILVLAGALMGVLLVLPVLLGLARLAAPFASEPRPAPGPFTSLPPLLWALLAALPLEAGAIGWLTAQLTVRAWLRLLP